MNNNKKLVIDRLGQLKIESGLSDKTFKITLASITGKTPRTIRRWYSLENNVHETDIERIAKFFGKHVHWLRYGDRNTASSAVDQIMTSDHFGAVIFKDNKVEEFNYKFSEMMNLPDSEINDSDINQQDICDYILQLQSEETAKQCYLGNDSALSHGAHIDQMVMLLGDNKKHHIESTTLNLNNGRVLRLLFDKGLLQHPSSEAQTHTELVENSSKKTDPELLKILFVDDDLANCQLYNTMLSVHNCVVSTFNNSLSALHDFKQNHEHYDLLISDIIMPNMTGDKLAQECRQLKPELPVVLCTGYDDYLNKTTAVEYGVSYYLQKPMNSNELLQILDSLR